jgi:hypothetical protein
MPKVSKKSVEGLEQGPATEWAQELGECKAGFVTISVDTDLTELLKGLPGDQCHCPHSGYVFKGRMWFRFGDRTEVYEAGDAFYAPPGHTAGAYADSEFLVFSPTDLIREVEAHMASRAQALRGA